MNGISPKEDSASQRRASQLRCEPINLVDCSDNQDLVCGIVAACKQRWCAVILKQFYLPCLAHASYIIGDEETRTAAVVDPQLPAAS